MRYDLTDFAWSVIEPLLPNEPRGDVEGTMQTIPAIYVEAVYRGLTTSYLVRLPNGAEMAVRHISDGRPGARFEPGEDVRVEWNAADARLHTGSHVNS